MARYLTANNPIKYWKQTGQGVVDGYTYRQGTWVEGVGFVSHVSTGWNGLHGYGVMQLDGTFCPRMTGASRYSGFGAARGAPHGCVIFMSGPVMWESWSEYYTWNYLTLGTTSCTGFGLFYSNEPPLYGESTVWRGNRTTWTDNTYLRVVNGWVQTGIKFGGYVFLWYNRYQVPIAPLPEGEPTASELDDNLWYFIYPNGRGMIVDLATAEIIRYDLVIDDLSSFWMARVVYCKEHDIFITVCSDPLNSADDEVRQWDDWHRTFVDRPSYMRVYVNEGVPTGVGPIIMDPDPAEVGQVSAVSVHLYGAQGEPVENEKVNWSIVEGGGTLTSSQSITNGLGIATTGYVPPLVPESVKIRAEVAY